MTWGDGDEVNHQLPIVKIYTKDIRTIYYAD